MKEELKELSKGIGKAVETVPELYQDAFQPSAQEVGKLAGRVPRVINALLSNVDIWTLKREYAVKEAQKLLELKLEHIDQEKIVEPESYVAIPAIQAISYSMGNEELRNLYANLLAKAMIDDTKESVHPSFVEIIKQMSPIDALVFKMIVEAGIRPIINLRRKTPSDGSNIIQNHYTWIKDFSIKQCATSIDNLLRLGLIEIPFGKYYIQQEIYNHIKENPLFQELEQESVKTLADGEIIDYEKSYIKLSDFSMLFYNICVVNP